MRLRAAIAVAAAVAWAIALWLGLHESGEPRVLGRYSLPYFGAIAAVGACAALLSVGTTARGSRVLGRHGRIPALLLASTLLCLALAEGFVRATDLLGISYYEESRRYMLDKVADEDLYNRHVPHLRQTYQGVEVGTNELGLRERPIQAKGAQEFRILILGDSVTLGWGVEVEETFARRLEASLDLRSTRSVRTINSGVGGYNTEMEQRFVARHGASLDPDLLLLVYVANDAEPTPSVRYDPRGEIELDLSSPPTALKLMLWESWLYRLARHVTKARRVNWAPTSGALPPEAVPRVPGTITPRLAASMAALEEIARFADERRIPFVAFVYRFTDDLFLANATREIGERADARGFLSAALQIESGDPPIREIVLSPVDIHPNALGHALIAEKIERFLLDRQLVP